MIRPRTTGASVLLFFLCSLGLLASGRLASSDAGDQLQAATMLALTGRLGDEGAGPADEAWVRAPNGRSYQAHDIGNILLMLPAAWLGARLSQASAAEDIQDPPALSRVAVSIACACLAAIGCFWIFQFFSVYRDTRTAFIAALGLPAATIFIAYARAAWDVLGGAVFVAGVLCYSARLLRDEQPRRAAMLTAATLAGACSFRFSLAPFLVPAACIVFLRARRRVPPRVLAVSAAVFLLLMLPSFAYNAVRTGSPLRPATASAQYLAGNNALTGTIPHGLYGLFLSPNRGLFVFSPILLFVVALPFAWRRLHADQRWLIGAFGLGATAYAILIAKMQNWGAFGWGPRYLVPVLPIVFVAAVLPTIVFYSRLRPVIVAAAVCSIALTIPPAFVNWHLATTTFGGAADPEGALPYQLVGGWRALVWGLQGRALPLPDDSPVDAMRATTATFPDLLVARLARHSAAGLLAALLVVTICVWLAARSAKHALARESGLHG